MDALISEVERIVLHQWSDVGMVEIEIVSRKGSFCVQAFGKGSARIVIETKEARWDVAESPQKAQP